MLIFSFLALFGASSLAKTLPSGVVGFYCLLADDTVKGYTSTDDWQPSLYNFTLNGSNVIYLTFMNPTTMNMPPAFINLAKCRGTGQSGCPTNQIIIASVGGEAYSQNSYTWAWLNSQQSAEDMAANVSKWDTLYGIDGIDLDIESPDGDLANYAENIVHFASKVKELNPNFIITQPVYGYPQVQAENNMVNNGWDSSGNPTGILDSIGIMYYENTKSLSYVDNYSEGPSKGDGITVNVPTNQIVAGIQGGSHQATTMANDCVTQKVQGIMVWYTSVYDATNQKEAFNYGKADDAYQNPNYYDSWAQALQILTQ